MFPGRIIGDRFRVLRVLGRGGMGVVSEVEAIDSGEHYAIKFLREDVESDIQPNARFLREAKLATKLQSPHTCRILSVGDWELGPYILMELLEGRSLNVLLERGRQLAWKQAARIAYEMCDALAEAHGLGIVHRDVKPGNVFLARTRTAHALTKVLDFGVAKIPSSVVTKHGEHSLTDASTLLGTPSYVAPEQLINSKLVDARADVWAVGVMLYEMLAGQLPFNSPLVPKLLVMIARDDPQPLELLAPSIPKELAQIVDRCLLKHPALRYADAGALAQALRPWVDSTADLLEPLLLVASLRPSLRATDPPVSVPEASLDHPTCDSLGPHTTANLGKRMQSRRSRGRYVASGASLGLVAALIYFFVSPAAWDWHRTHSSAVAAPTAAPAAPHEILLIADPAQAQFEFDGTLHRANPLRLLQQDDGREHQLVVSAPGFASERRTLHFHIDQQISISLRPQSAETLGSTSTPLRHVKPRTSAPKSEIDSAGHAAPKTRALDQENPF